VAKSDYDARTTPSVLDRLLDEEPALSRDPVRTRSESMRQYRAGVQRDLEELLNTRDPWFDLAADFVEARQSALTFGLPDFSHLTSNRPGDLARLRDEVEACIRRFEPRLADPTVTVQQGAGLAVRLHVEARLIVEPNPEPVAFDILVPSPSRKYEVREPL
jgi:type VI secretion system protein ImpF